MSTANKKHSNEELVRMIRDELEAIGEQCEQSWLNSVDDYAYLLDPSETDAREFIREFKFSIEIEPFKIGKIQIGDTIDLLRELGRIKLDEDTVAALLFKHCAIEASQTVYKMDNTLNSMTIGEIEEQVDFEYHDDLRALIEQLPEDVREERDWNDSHTYIYTRPCEFIAAVLDVEAFIVEVKQLIRAYDRKNKGPATLYEFSSRRPKQRAAEYSIALKQRELFRPNYNNVIRVTFGGAE
jgi:hypothetical protein